jgi:hypothetical protein
LDYPGQSFPSPPASTFCKQDHAPDRRVRWWLDETFSTFGDAVLEVDQSWQVEEIHLHESGPLNGGVECVIGKLHSQLFGKLTALGQHLLEVSEQGLFVGRTVPI